MSVSPPKPSPRLFTNFNLTSIATSMETLGASPVHGALLQGRAQSPMPLLSVAAFRPAKLGDAADDMPASRPAKLGPLADDVASFRASEAASDEDADEENHHGHSSRSSTPAALRREARRAARAARAVLDPQNPLGEDDNEPDVPARPRGGAQASRMRASEGSRDDSSPLPLRNPLQAARNLLPNVNIAGDLPVSLVGEAAHFLELSACLA
jgi:hypothetical protein